VGLWSEDSPGRKFGTVPKKKKKKTKTKCIVCVTQVVEPLPSKCEAQSSNLSNAGKKERKNCFFISLRK
jgi:hypothetical protein